MFVKVTQLFDNSRTGVPEDSVVEMHCSIHPVGGQHRIPFGKANGFCYPERPVNQEELKWELRSQIHPASNPVQTENSSSTVNLLNEKGF